MQGWAKLKAGFFTGTTGRVLRAHRDAQVVAVYLLACDSAHPIGLYRLPMPTLCHEVGIKPPAALKALQVLQDAGFALYDQASEYVFVPEMASVQIAPEIKPTDKRAKWIEKAWLERQSSPFFVDFHNRYREPFNLPPLPPQGTLKGLRRPIEGASNARGSEGASEPHRSQTTDRSTSTQVGGYSQNPGGEPSHAHTHEGASDARPTGPNLRVVA